MHSLRATPRLIRRFPLFVVVLVLVLAAGVRSGAAMDTIAKQAVLMDMKTGAVLFEKNADAPMEPASMTKMMTVYLVFERLRDGRLSLDDELSVSEKAWRKGGSKMFIDAGDRVSVEDLLRGIIVQSGNDASIALAEGLAGSEETFAEEMNRKAREMGLENTAFKNSTGWPEEGHRSTAHDMALLAKHTIEDFPEYYHYYAETTFTYNGIRQGNRNPLLYNNGGADGLKTGHIEEAGYGLAVSVERDGRRLILVVHGLPSVQARAQESRRLMKWGFREFDNYELFKAGETVADARVWLGEKSTVPMVADSDIVVTLPRKARRDMRVAAMLKEPIPAPIGKDTRIATLVVSAPGVESTRVPLFAGTEVKRLGVVGRLGAAVRHLVWGSQQ